jgi:hypothetical protein
MIQKCDACGLWRRNMRSHFNLWFCRHCCPSLYADEERPCTAARIVFAVIVVAFWVVVGIVAAGMHDVFSR